jgi:glycosyltransferase involved in cell wall biosynthesis
LRFFVLFRDTEMIAETYSRSFAGVSPQAKASARQAALFVGAFPATSPLERYVSGDLSLKLKSVGWVTGATSCHSNRFLRLVDMLLEIWRARQNYSIACVDVFSGPAFVWAEAACALLRKLGKPTVLTLHGGNLPEFIRTHPRRVERLLESAEAVTCPSEYLRANMHSLRGDIALIPNGVEVSCCEFHFRQAPFRKLMWLRAFHEIYNPEMAIRVLRALRQRGMDCDLTMIGPDKGDGSLARTKELVAQEGLAGFVHFRGAVPKKDVPREISSGDLFLNTSNVDNTPVSVIEALACGLPVVSTNAGGLPYLLADGKTALLVRTDDTEGMASAVMRISSQPHVARRLSETGRKLAESFDWSVVLPMWTRLLEQVLAAKDRE